MSTTRERYLAWKYRCSLPQLPIEIWSEIFSHLNVSDLLSVRLVCRMFLSCVNQYSNFWSLIIFDYDQCPKPSVALRLIQNIRLFDVDLITRSNRFAHSTIYFTGQKLLSSQTRRKRRLLFQPYADDNDQKKKHDMRYFRCHSIQFSSLRSFDAFELQMVLSERIRRLTFSYECSTTEPSLSFLLKLERLRCLQINFVHHFDQIDAFALLLINTMSAIVLILFRLHRLKSLTLTNLHLNQSLPSTLPCQFTRLRSLWLEDCKNVHHLLSSIVPNHLKNVIIRRSTCDRRIFSTFVEQLSTIEYFDLSSFQFLPSSIPLQPSIELPATLKLCSVNQTFLRHCSRQRFPPSLELIDIDESFLVELDPSSLQCLCIFLTMSDPPLSSFINHFRLIERWRSCRIHLHIISTSESIDLPSNVFVLPCYRSMHCFRYEMRMC